MPGNENNEIELKPQVLIKQRKEMNPQRIDNNFLVMFFIFFGWSKNIKIIILTFLNEELL